MFNLREESSDYHLAFSEVKELSRQFCVRILVTNHKNEKKNDMMITIYMITVVIIIIIRTISPYRNP